MAWTREQIASRATQELRNGYYVNLGIGIPTLVANYISSERAKTSAEFSVALQPCVQ